VKAEDPLGAALAAVFIGSATGGAVVCLVLLASYWMPRGPDTTFGTIALLGAAGGLMAGAIVGWTLARSLPVWRRAVVAMIAAAGTALVGVLTTAADIVGGPAGLAVLAGLCLLVIVGAYRIFLAPERRS